MMNTYKICLENANGRLIDCEACTEERLEDCIETALMRYKANGAWGKELLTLSERVAAYRVSENDTIYRGNPPEWSLPADEFLKLMEGK